MKPSTSLRRILVPFDFSEGAEEALAFALRLADRDGAKLTLMHAYETPAYDFVDGPAVTSDTAAQIARSANAALDRVAKRLQTPGVQVESVVRNGPTSSEIVSFAKEADVDLIVMGTHGRRPRSLALIGSVAERVIHTAPCPVLSVRGRDAAG